METISNNTLPELTPSKRRRRHSPDFRARVVAECDQPGVSIAAVARHHQLNANLVHKWRKAAKAGNHSSPVSAPGFIPLSLPTTVADTDTRVTLIIGELTIQWPLNHIHQAVPWIKALQS